MHYKGKYKIKNPDKYKGNPTNIVYRSSWELKFMNYLDNNPNVVWWSSEEMCVPYYNPVDQKPHRYFPDFLMCVKQKDGSEQTFMVEIKPEIQTKEPEIPSRKTKKYIMEVFEYAKNQAKWKYAEEYCKDRGWRFQIITEADLNIKWS